MSDEYQPVVKPVLVLVEGGLPTPICYPESMALPRPFYAVMRGGGEDDFGLQSLLLSCDALLCDKGNPLADVAKKVGMKVFHSIEEMNV